MNAKEFREKAKGPFVKAGDRAAMQPNLNDPDVAALVDEDGVYIGSPKGSIHLPDIPAKKLRDFLVDVFPREES